jgi:hypothetical protein
MLRKPLSILVIMIIMVMSSCSHNIWDPAHKVEGAHQKKLRNQNNKCQFSTEN